jgi:hypothetical protein
VGGSFRDARSGGGCRSRFLHTVEKHFNARDAAGRSGLGLGVRVRWDALEIFAWPLVVHQEVGEPPRGLVRPEAMNMDIESDVLVALAEEVLHTKADGKERWCVAWLEWFWEQEIEMAISDVKEGRL